MDLLYFLLLRCESSFNLGKMMLELALETPNLTRERKKVLCTWLIEGRDDVQQHGRDLLKALMGGKRPSGFTGLSTAMFGLVPDYLKRRALFGLAQLEDDPAAVAHRYFGVGERHDAVPFDQAVADVIEEFHEEMDTAEVREMVEEGARASKLQIRLRFYRLGLALYGSDFIRPALKDRSKKVRSWAEKQLSGE